jgi:hypothetical protein
MIKRAHNEPRSVPNPSYGKPNADGHRYPSAVLVKVVTSDGGLCECCGQDMDTGACAVALYVKPYDGVHAVRSFAFSDLILCPWCAELPEEEMRSKLLDGVRRYLALTKEALTKHIRDKEEEGPGDVCGIEFSAECARLLATACTGLILKPGEAWTPTSHPGLPLSEKWLAAMKARHDEYARVESIMNRDAEPLDSASRHCAVAP